MWHYDCWLLNIPATCALWQIATDHYILILVWMTFTLTQGHRGVRKQNILWQLSHKVCNRFWWNVMNLVLILSCWISIQGREPCSGDFCRTSFNVGLCSDIHRPIFFSRYYDRHSWTPHVNASLNDVDLSSERKQILLHLFSLQQKISFLFGWNLVCCHDLLLCWHIYVIHFMQSCSRVWMLHRRFYKTVPLTWVCDQMLRNWFFQTWHDDRIHLQFESNLNDLDFHIRSKDYENHFGVMTLTFTEGQRILRIILA